MYQLGALPEDVQGLLENIAVAVSLGFDGLGSVLRCSGLASPVNVLTFWLIVPYLITILVSAGSILWAAVKKRGEPAWFRQAVLWSMRPALLIAFGSYPIVASAAFQAFACEPLGDVSLRFLPPTYTLECGPAGQPTAENGRPDIRELTACHVVTRAGALEFQAYLANSWRRCGIHGPAMVASVARVCAPSARASAPAGSTRLSKRGPRFQ